MEGPSIHLAAEQLRPFCGRPVRAVSGNSTIGITRLRKKRVDDIFAWGKHLVFQFDTFALRVHFLLWGTFAATVKKKSVTGDYRRSGPPRLVLTFANGNIIKNEVLFRTRTTPLATVGELTPRTLRAIVTDARMFARRFLELRRDFALRKNLEIYGKGTCARCEGGYPDASMACGNGAVSFVRRVSQSDRRRCARRVGRVTRLKQAALETDDGRELEPARRRETVAQREKRVGHQVTCSSRSAPWKATGHTRAPGLNASSLKGTRKVKERCHERT
jgi:hypothetical protein